MTISALPDATIAAKPSAKRLALFLDGTWNVEGDNTNVWRLRSLCARTGPDEVVQAIYYNSGVGTRMLERVSGGVLGYGLDRNVTDAYQWLVENYNDGDRIFIFGFSRGAYTARSLAGFITKCGLLRPGAPLGVNELYQRHRTVADDRMIRSLATMPASDLTLQERWLLAHAYQAPIAFIGVWDTVGSLGIPFGRLPGLSRSSFGFLSTGLYVSQLSAYQALAIDEHRPDFPPTLWTKRTYRDGRTTAPPRPVSSVEQRWFPGAHADVGGGYPSNLLAQAPLRWMMGKASQHGLAFREQVEPDESCILGELHDSYAEFMGGRYRFLPGRTRPLLREIGATPIQEPNSESATVNETIDASAFRKWQTDPTYRPANLQAWAARFGLSPGAIQGPVNTKDGSVVPP